jgi:hypothetical protein
MTFDNSVVYVTLVFATFVLPAVSYIVHNRLPGSKADTLLSAINTLSYQAVSYVEQVTPTLGMEGKTQAEKNSARLTLAVNIVNNGLKALNFKLSPQILLMVEAAIEAEVFHAQSKFPPSTSNVLGTAHTVLL